MFFIFIKKSTRKITKIAKNSIFLSKPLSKTSDSFEKVTSESLILLFLQSDKNDSMTVALFKESKLLTVGLKYERF